MRKANGRRGPGRRPTIYLAAASALGACLVLSREFTWGVAWDGDSTRYLAAARSLLAGAGFRDVYEVPFTDWPPLYPLLLAAGGFVFDPLEVAGPLNLGALALTIFCLGRYLWTRLHSSFLRVWAPLTLALSLPLLESARWAMSETVFILLATLALIGAGDYLTDGRREAFLRAAVFSALAWQTRYIGAAVVFTAGLFLLFRPGKVRERARRFLAFCGITATPMVVWLWRNYRLEGELVTQLMPSDLSLTATLGGIGDGLRSWADFDRSLPTILTVGALVLGAVIFRALRSDSNTETPFEKRIRPGTSPFAVFGVFWCTYLLLLVSALTVGFHGATVHARYLAPLVVPTAVVLATTVDRLLVSVRTRDSRLAMPVSALVMASLSLWLVGQAEPNVRAIHRANSRDFAVRNGFRSARWADSETLRALRDYPTGWVVTNSLSVVSLHTGRRLLGSLPRLEHLADEQRFAEWLRGAPDGHRLVWFHRWEAGRRSFTRTPPAFHLTPGVRPVEEFLDGAIFEVDRSFAPEDPSSLLSAFDALAVDGAAAPLASGYYDLYHDGNDFVYFRESCRSTDIEERFRLSLTSPAVSGSGRLVEHRYHDFDFGEYGVRRRGRCLAVVPLPTGSHTGFDTGQRAGAAPWRLTGWFDRERHRAALRSLASEGVRVVNSVFDIYLRGRELRYFKEPCVPSDVEVRFSLQLHPRPDDGQSRGSRNRDFDFREHGLIEDGMCLAVVPLPSERYSRFETGQWAGATSWRAAAPLDRARYRVALASLAAGEWGRPDVRAGFDLYLSENELRYFREPCTLRDVETRFFLHLHGPRSNRSPARQRMPPGSRRFENRDFDFFEWGVILDDRCLAMVPVAGGKVHRIATGQFAADGERLWSAELTLPSGR